MPLIQVSALLQSRKSKEDVQSICELCSSLTSAQVLKIIKSYVQDDCENPIEPVFIQELTAKLNERQTNVSGLIIIFAFLLKDFINLSSLFVIADIKRFIHDG